MDDNVDDNNDIVVVVVEEIIKKIPEAAYKYMRERLCSLCPDKIARGHNDSEMIFHLVSSSEPFFFLFHFINRD